MRLKTKFQDENFELGERVDAYFNYGVGDKLKMRAKPSKGEWITFYYDSIKEFTDHWEDAPEPKEDGLNNIITLIEAYNSVDGEHYPKEILDKLKAWQRLKDKGFRFDGVETFSEGLLGIDGVLPALKGADNKERLKMVDDLNSLFGGEE